jgi:hypothetical protein
MDAAQAVHQSRRVKGGIARADARLPTQRQAAANTLSRGRRAVKSENAARRHAAGANARLQNSETTSGSDKSPRILFDEVNRSATTSGVCLRGRSENVGVAGARNAIQGHRLEMP